MGSMAMATAGGVKIIYGAEGFTHIDAQEAAAILKVAKDGGIEVIDTANLYANSEKKLGNLKAAEHFVIHTKTPGVVPGCLSRQSILQGMEKSLRELGVASVDTYYLHTPDGATPLEETLSAIQQLYEEGKFRVFGVSNMSAVEVQRVYDVAKQNSYVRPSVYQGNYNPVARHMQRDLLPLLRQLGIKFYAYSPLAGGFLAKTARDIRAADTLSGRWSRDDPVGRMYHQLYNRPSLVRALEKWEQLADDNGVKMAELAYRWMLYHSSLSGDLGDAIVVGARRASQLEETLRFARKGPLEEHILPHIEDIWQLVENEVRLSVNRCENTTNVISQAPIDNMQG